MNLGKPARPSQDSRSHRRVSYSLLSAWGGSGRGRGIRTPGKGRKFCEGISELRGNNYMSHCSTLGAGKGVEEDGGGKASATITDRGISFIVQIRKTVRKK